MPDDPLEWPSRPSALTLDARGHRAQPMQRRLGRRPRLGGGQQERETGVGAQRGYTAR
jgi:hypothetical protein